MLGAQQWRIEFEKPSVFMHGVINEKNEAIIVGRESDENDGTEYPAVFKIMEDGRYEVFSFDNEFKDIKFAKVLCLPNGNYFVSGCEKTGDIGNNSICDIHVMIMDSNMDVVRHEQYSAIEHFSFNVNHDIIIDGDKVLMVCSTFGDELNRRKPTFMQFNFEGELLSSLYPDEEDETGGYSNVSFGENQLKKKPDGTGYLVISKLPARMLQFDNNFDFEGYSNLEHPKEATSLYNSSEVCSDLWLSDDNLMLYGTYNNYRHDPPRTEVIISSVNMNGTISEYKVIYSDTCHYDAFQGNNAMSYVNDSTIYGGSCVYQSHSNHIVPPSHFQMHLFTREMEILGTLTTNYAETNFKNILTYSNGDLLVTSSHSIFQPYLITSITKYSRADFNPTYVGIKDVPAEEIANMVYPNPTDGELNIDIRGIDTGSENRVRIIDVNGRVLTSRIIRGSGNVLTMDVSSLDAGVYVYEVFNAEGTISKGRFVKK